MKEFILKNKLVLSITALLLTLAVLVGGYLMSSNKPAVSDNIEQSSQELFVEESSQESSSEEESSSEISSSESQVSTSSVAPPKPSSTAPKPPVSAAPVVSSKPATPPKPVPVPNGKNVVGYYTGYSSYSGFTPDKVAVENLTHINYAFAKIDNSNKIALPDYDNDVKNLKALKSLKSRNKNLKLLISVGGWEYSNNFSNAALTKESRSTFAKSCVDFVVKYGLDGVDLDWEFPVSGGPSHNTNRPEDKQNFTLMLKELRAQLDKQGEKDGKRYYLTIAAAPNSTYLKKIELSKIEPLVDYIFIMGYDMHGPWDSYSDLNAPLYTPSENSPQYKNSISSGVSLYLNTISSSKLVLGVPFYGYKYDVNSDDNDGLYQDYSSAKSVGYDNVVKNYLNNPDYTEHYHEDAKVPYLSSYDSFITFENTKSIKAKAQYAKSKGLGGVGAWELSHDRNGTLLSALNSGLK